jgi:hypothetical protein
MIKFFRRIRQKLVSENRFSKYALYAVGEIVLVVIGILIALQINNWNTGRLQKKQENLLLQSLNDEFKKNKEQLDSVTYFHHRSFKSAEYVKSKLPLDLKNVNLDSIAFHLYYMGWIYTYNPSTGIINSLLNNSTFEIISNRELRQLLISYNDILSDYQEEEQRAFYNYLNHLKPYEKANFNLNYDYKKWLSDPRTDLGVLESLSFDNYVQDRHNDLNEIINNTAGEYELLQRTTDRIIELSKQD